MRKRARSGVLLALGLALAGCSAPETLESPLVRGVLIFPGLTYARGDAKEGKTTIASLPLLSYYESKEKDGNRESRLCFLPFLASVGRETRNVRRVALSHQERPRCPDDEPPPDPARRGKIVVRPAEEDDALPESPPLPERRAPSPSTPRRIDESGRSRARSSTPESAKGTKVLFEESAERTSVDFLFPLVHVERERPGRVVLQRPGRERSVVEVGSSTDDVRFLPIFSYDRTATSHRVVIWPLLASGYENEPGGRYLRFLYFLKIRIGDGEPE
ncbi:hypothetical protein HY251_06585 [bacterium]|nr:hypothetical protein [bacterium]